ncbi:tetratricopeptide repeat protein [Bacillus aerolatus]|uniref:Tetratricopeptide repeat protein n=1 Tax=Bacillus aerolatus TaxID=2653354 RepID=A0A6I1FTQ4_9BACI|nr:tetratricopeptide repeat protein [Bacillus aerolatus]KAB7705848.1 tetratricopeptide repeat protein [Bacillus aerolatus]
MNAVKTPSQIETVSQLINTIHNLWMLKSIKALRTWLAQIDTEDEYYRLIRLADAGAMYGYSNFLAVMANKRFQSVRTFSWYCFNLLEQGKSLDAETKMKQRLFNEDIDALTTEERRAAYLLLVKALCQLHRYKEAAEYIRLIKEEGSFLAPDQIADFYIETNDWARAEQEVMKGLDLPFNQRGDVSWLVYADLLSRQGKHEEALQVLKKGADIFPDQPVFQLEQLRRFRHTGNFLAILEHVERLDKENPFHVNVEYFIYLKAEALYYLEKWKELQGWISRHEALLKNTEFSKRTIQPDGAYQILPIQPIRQKLNYCVPATLSMVLQTAGRTVSQDEIARHVFDVTGSKLTTAIDYMASIGFSSTFFKGTIELYKHFIDAGCPIMLDMLIENNSHVQLVIGYDDRLGVLLVQDPNELETLMISYEEVTNAYRLKDQLSIVFIRDRQKDLLECLNEQDHQFFQQIFFFLEKMEQDAEVVIDEFLAYLAENDREIFASIIGLTMIQHAKAKPLLNKWIEHVKERFGKEDEEVQLLIAHAYYMHDQTGEEFQRVMNHVKQKNAYAHFLLGVVDYQNDQTERAIFHLKRSLEKDPFQPSAYAYLARCYADFSQFQLARQWALVALEQAETDEFTRSTYAVILLEAGAVREALAEFEKLSEDYPNDHYYVYEIGRCYMETGDKRAMKWLKRAIDMNPAVPYPYLHIAEIRMNEEKWERAEAYLRIGAEDSVPEEETGILWLYIGHTRMGREMYDHAEEAYQRAVQLDDDGELLAVVYEAQSIIKQGDWQRAQQVIQRSVNLSENPDMYVRAGAMMIEEAKGDREREVGLDFMEAGMMEGGELAEHVSMYVDYVEDTPFIHRALSFLQKLRVQYPLSDLYCYEAIFHEHLGNVSLTETLLLEAAALDSRSTFPHYRLGKLYRILEEYKAAEQYLLECLVLNPDFTAAHDELAHLYEEMGNIDKAKKHRFHVFETMPQTCDVGQLAGWMSSSDERQKLKNHLDSLRGTIDEEWRLLALSEVIETEEAIRLLEKEESVELKAKLAALYTRNGQAKEALTLMEALIQEEPDNEVLYEPWIEALYSSKKLLKIEKIIKKMELSPESAAVVYRNSGAALIPYVEAEAEDEQRGIWRKISGGLKTVGLIGAVVALYEKAIELDPDNPEAYDRLALFYVERDVADDALKVLKRYLARHEDDSLRFKAAASAMSYGTETGKEKYIKEAQEYLLLLKERRPSDGGVRELLADTFLFLGHPAAAMEEYEILIEKAPYKTEGYVGRILVHLELEQVQEAKQYLEQTPEQMRKRVFEQLKEMAEEHSVVEEWLDE